MAENGENFHYIKLLLHNKISALLISVTSDGRGKKGGEGLNFCVCADKIRSPGNQAIVFSVLYIHTLAMLFYPDMILLVNKFKFYCGSNFPEYALIYVLFPLKYAKCILRCIHEMYFF